jgi:hypothetical protein
MKGRVNTPMRRIRSACCARVASDHAAAAQVDGSGTLTAIRFDVGLPASAKLLPVTLEP